MPEIGIKRVYETPAAADGARVLVDRLWPRGVSREKAALAHWHKDIAPSTALRTWFGHEARRWATFVRRYEAELDRNPEAVEQSRDLVKQGRVTLLYGARDTTHNHALILADYMRRHP